MLELQHLQNLSSVPYGWFWLIVGAPLLGAVVNGLWALASARFNKFPASGISAWIACSASFLSFFTVLETYFYFRSLPENSVLTQSLFSWVEVSDLRFTISFQLDALSLVMALLITFLSTLIHVYSIGFLKGDPGFSRYFTYLNLSLFFMLILVLADDLLFLFVGWEGTAVCASLLIGFCFREAAKSKAAQKAFLVNRVGDLGFIAGILLTAALTGTLNFNDLQTHRQDFHEGLATLVGLCFFLAAAAKSAQIPLMVWLPDSIEAPIPGTAFLQSITLATAGIYLMVRLHFLYVLAPWASLVIALAGMTTAFLGAVLALTQNDLKKILAYSTLSQLGFMVLAVGVSAYEAGIFQLITHGFSKTCLFLAAGSLIAALEGETDIRKMGGLLKHLPIASLAFLLGWLSLTAIVPFSGFFSLNEILWRTLATPNPLMTWLPEVLYCAALGTLFLSAYAMTRLVVLVFFGDYRGDREKLDHLRESSWEMTVPLLFLALVSLMIGWIGIPEAIGGGDGLGSFLNATFRLSTLEPNGVAGRLEPVFMLVFFSTVSLGVGISWAVHSLKYPFSSRLLKWVPAGEKAVEERLGMDSFYEKTIAGSIRWAADWICRRLLDELLLLPVVKGLARGASRVGGLLKKNRIGWVRFYLAYVFLGAVLVVYFLSRG
jgi:NADH-quinone oxidoreductase subunit L